MFLVQKHRTSWTETSVLLMQNLRTLWQRSPMFPVFRPENARKSPFPDFAIFQNEARCGGFRGHSQPVNEVVREGWRHLEKDIGKIAHSPACPRIHGVRFRGVFYWSVCHSPLFHPLTASAFPAGFCHCRGRRSDAVMPQKPCRTPVL